MRNESYDGSRMMVSGIHKDARCRIFLKCSLRNIYEGIRRTMKREAAFIDVTKNVAIDLKHRSCSPESGASNLKYNYCSLKNMNSVLMIRIPNLRKTSIHPAKIMIRLTIVVLLFNALE